MHKSAPLQDLLPVLGPARLRRDSASRHLYSYDAAFDEELPLAVALPQSTAEVAEIMRVCARHGLPVVPRGAGTSLSGGPIPAPGSLVLSFTRMNRVLELCPAEQLAVVQPGVVNLDLQKQAEALGYFYAPDPSSQLVSTIGGNLGHNAGGPHCLKYGVTAHHILGVELVTAEGEVLRLGGRTLETPGYNWLGLVVGGEGTLGVVTEITCRLLPLPAALGTALAIFDTLEGASESVSGIIARGIVPAALEMLDQTLIGAVEQHLHAGYPLDAAAVLLIEVDGAPEAIAPQLAAIEEVCRGYGVREIRVAQTAAEREALWRGRKGTAAAVANLAPGKLSTDVVVPRTVLPQMVRRVTEIGRAHDLVIGVLLHAGDGNLHPQIVFDPRDTDQLARVRAAQEEIVRAALGFGGGITGEHGVGTEKRKYMCLMFGASEISLMRGIKQALDPRGLCNPGKLLPEAPEATPPPVALPAGSFAEVATSLAPRNAQGHWQPADYESFGRLLALASREGQQVEIVGGGDSTAESREILSTLSLSQILDIQAANLTVIAQAGRRLGALQEALRAVGQWWPVLPPAGAERTLGGIVATGLAGPYAGRFGRVQDLITGVKLALPSGEVVSFGIPCVKNVAGYALERMVVGSRGTLCAILELTLRTLPLPEGELPPAETAPESPVLPAGTEDWSRRLKALFDPAGILPEMP
jgi:glycolate oxidase subunit GlcD